MQGKSTIGQGILSQALWTLTKLSWRSARGAVEHGAESADALVAKVQRDLRDGLSTAQPTHRFQHARLLPPRAETEAGFALEAARQRAGAGIDGAGPSRQRPPVPRRAQHLLAQAAQTGIAWHWQLQGQRLQSAQFGQD